MKIYQAENVDAGQMAGLILSPAPGTPGKTGANGLLRDISFAAHTDGLGENVGRYLLPGTYIAVLDGNPFLENALGQASSPKRTKSSSVVFGVLGINRSPMKIQVKESAQGIWQDGGRGQYLVFL